jgi:hypothetical protein
MAAERSDVRIHKGDVSGWEYPAGVAAKLQWPATRFQVLPAGKQ